jgi:hypothetical protein
VNATKLDRLVARLRELEAETLRLEERILASSQSEDRKTYQKRLDRLEASHSHSWFGDHASTYYGEFRPPPGGETFNVEWGFVPGFDGSHNPGWRTFSRDEIRAFTFGAIGEDICYSVDNLAKEIIEQFTDIRDQALDVLEVLSSVTPSKAISRYATALEAELEPYSVVDYINSRAKSTPNMTRDAAEIAKGKNVPAHVQYLAPIQSLDVNRLRLRELAGVLRKAIEAVNLTNEISNTVYHLYWSWAI